MKAKQYFERYVNEYSDKSIEWKVIKTFIDIFNEAEQIAKIRNTDTDMSFRAIFKELNKKANSFCRIVNEIDDFGLKENSFMIFVEDKYPEIYEIVFK
jgi:hypothetical protein